MYSLQKTIHWIYEKRQQDEAEEKEIDQKQKVGFFPIFQFLRNIVGNEGKIGELPRSLLFASNRFSTREL